MNWWQGHGRLRLIDACAEWRLAHLVQSNRRPTVAQIAKEVNAGSEYTVHRNLLHMGLHSCRPARVPMLTSVHHQKVKVAWSDESCFLLHHVDGQVRVRVRRLPGEHMAPGCTMERRQAGRGSVMLFAMFYWVILGPAIHVDATLTCTLLQNIYTLSWKWYSLLAVASFSRIMPQNKNSGIRFRNGLRNTTTRMFSQFPISQSKQASVGYVAQASQIHGGSTIQRTCLSSVCVFDPLNCNLFDWLVLFLIWSTSCRGLLHKCNCERGQGIVSYPPETWNG